MSRKKRNCYAILDQQLLKVVDPNKKEIDIQGLNKIWPQIQKLVSPSRIKGFLKKHQIAFHPNTEKFFRNQGKPYKSFYA